LTLSTPLNKTLTFVRRPALVFPAQHIFFRNKPGVVSLTVQMLSSFLPGTSDVIAFVEIGRRDRWTSIGSGEGREISIAFASVRGRVVHHGIRGLVSRFPIIFASISALLFLLILSAILGACILPSILPRSSRIGDSTRGSPLSTSSISSQEDEEKPPMKRRRTRLSRSMSRNAGAKEISTNVTPSTNVKPHSLRRRSRLYEGLSDSES